MDSVSATLLLLAAGEPTLNNGMSAQALVGVGAAVVVMGDRT